MTTSAQTTTARQRPADAAPPRDARPDPSSLIDRMPPHDLAAEAGVLGSIVIDPDILGIVRMMLPNPSVFWKDENSTIYRIILELQDAGKKIDAMILYSTLKTLGLLESVGGIEYIKDIANSVPTSAHVGEYAAIVAEKSKLRELITACTRTLRDCYEGVDIKGGSQAVVEKGMKRIFDVAAMNVHSFPEQMGDVANSLLSKLEEQHRTNAPSGLPTGFIDLDARLTGGGLQKGDYIIIAARPSVGKTTFAMQIAEHVSIDLLKTAGMFSLEMNKDAIAQRLLTSRAAINAHKFQTGSFTEAEKTRLSQTLSEVAGCNWWIDDTPSISFTELRTKAIRLKQQHDVALFLVDYLGLMPPMGRDNRNEEVGKLSLALKGLARELMTPVIVLSQLNRKCEDEMRPPRSSDLRDSGNLEQDADLIILLHREACYHRGDVQWAENNVDKLSEAQAIIAKQRNGPVESVQLQFLPWCTRFTSIQRQDSSQSSFVQM